MQKLANRLTAIVFSALILLVAAMATPTASAVNFPWTSSVDVHFTQCANDGSTPGECTWTTSTLQSSNSDYEEGMSVPQRILIKNLPSTPSWVPDELEDVHSLVFYHQFTENGKHAYDFLTAYNQGNDPTIDLNACEDLSDSWATICTALRTGAHSYTLTLPTDNYVSKDGNTADHIAAFEAEHGPRSITIYTNEPISDVSIHLLHDKLPGQDTGDSYVVYVLTWKSEADQLLIEMGAHLAVGEPALGDLTTLGWGENMGASQPWSSTFGFGTKLLDLKKQEKNLDIKMKYIDEPEPTVGKLVIKKIVINNDGGTAVPADFMLDVDAESPSATSVQGSESGVEVYVEPGAYSVAEETTTAYTTSYSDACTGTIKAGKTKTCIVTNNDVAPKLTVRKIVGNDNGGTLQVEDFPLFVDNTQVVSHVQNEFVPGTYVVTETQSAGYKLIVEGDCDVNGQVTLALGDVKECILFNSDQPAELTVEKVFVGGGSATIDDVTLRINGTEVEHNVPVELKAGEYTVSEDPLVGYTTTFSGDCDANGDVTLIIGEAKKCTVTNTYIPPVCGNGIKEADEACDAGSENASSCDAGYGESCTYCTASCTIGTDRGPFCGDGQQNGNEQCDGIAPSGYSCSDACILIPDQPEEPVCGNQAIEEGETCDDGNTVSGDGCSAECSSETVCEPEVNVLSNGGFEAPVVTTSQNWDLFPSGNGDLVWTVEWADAVDGQPETALAELHDSIWTPYEGTQYSELDSDWDGPTGTVTGEQSSVTLSQQVDTVPGETYTIRFAFSPRPNTDSDNNALEVRWEGDLIATVSEAGGSSTQWTVHEYNVTATGASAEVTFTDVGTADGMGTLLDGVSVVCVPPPAPVCGNQIEEDGEACDDGNTENGDGCSELCTIEIVCEEGLELVGNGDFEMPLVTTTEQWDIFASGENDLNWTVEWATLEDGQPETPFVEIHNDLWTPYNGEQYTELDSDWQGPASSETGEPASVMIYQDIDTFPGETYTLRFAFSPRPNTAIGDNILEVLWEGTIIDTIDATGSADTDWTEHVYSVEATGTTSRIAFVDRGTPNSEGTLLDGVSVQCTPQVNTCGDGVRQPTEQCDGQDVMDGFTCSQECTLIPICVPETLAEAPYAADGIVSVDQGTQKGGQPVAAERSIPAQGLEFENGGTPSTFFALGYGGSLTVEFSVPAIDGPGDDIQVFEVTNGNYPEESVDVFASEDGVTYVLLGSTDNSNQANTHTGGAFDLGAAGLSFAKFVRVNDTTNPALHNAASDGYDLNAVLALHDHVGEGCTELTCETALSGGLLVAEIDGNEATINNYAGVPFTVSLAAYEMYAATLWDQQLVSSETGIVTDELTLSVGLPVCSYQLDVVCGEPLQNNPEYGDRVIAHDFGNEEAGFCTPPPTGDVTLSIGDSFPQGGEYMFVCDADFEATEYHWYFGDGNIQHNMTNESVLHTYEPGNYTVACTATNSTHSGTDVLEIEVLESEPEPEPAVNLTVQDGYPNLGQYSLSCENNFEADTFDWNFGDGDSLTDVPNEDVFHTFVDAGTYHVTCTATNGLTTLMDTIELNVTEVADVTLVVDPLQTEGGFGFTCENNFSATTFDWDFGDGTTLLDVTNQSVQHTYNADGNYSVSCTATSTDFNLVDSSAVEVVLPVELAIPVIPQGRGGGQVFECDRFSWVDTCPDEPQQETSTDEPPQQVEQPPVIEDEPVQLEEPPETERNFLTGAFIGAFGSMPAWMIALLGLFILVVAGTAVTMRLKR